jgi:hypothetical protein
MLSNTDHQIEIINEYFNSNGISNVYLSENKQNELNSLVIELRNKHQAVTLLTRINQLKPGLILYPEDILLTFDEKKHRYLIIK